MSGDGDDAPGAGPEGGMGTDPSGSGGSDREGAGTHSGGSGDFHREDGGGLAAELERCGLEDVRPLYRTLLRELREADAARYEEAVTRYRETVEPAGSDGAEAPLAVWIAYGRWLAERIAPGRTVAVDATGLSRELGPEAEVPDGALVLHLPEDRRRRALILAAPARPSPHQEATRELLAG